MYTILSTLSGMGLAKKLSSELEGSSLLTIEEVLGSPEKLDGCEYLGLVFSNEGVEIPSEVEDLIFDVLRLNDRLKKIKYMFSICLYARSVGHALMIVEKLCRKFGHAPELNLSFKTRSKNNVDVQKSLFHIQSQDHIIANGRIGTSIYMTTHAIWTGRLREEEKKIEERPDIYERTKRFTVWTIGLVLMIVSYALFIFIAVLKLVKLAPIPHLLNLVAYGSLLIVLFALMKYLLRFPIRRLMAQDRRFSVPLFLLGFASMAVPAIAISFIFKALNPDNYSLTISDNWVLVFSLGPLMAFIKSLLFALLATSYLAYFKSDYLPSDRKNRIAYCFISAVVYALMSFRNPKVYGALGVYHMALHFIIGFALMAFLLRTKGIEVSWGVNFAYMLLRAILFADGEITAPNPIYTINVITGPTMFFQGILFIVLSALIISFLLGRKGACKRQSS